jgi:hypothetical protein
MLSSVESCHDELKRKRGGHGTCPIGRQIMRHIGEVSSVMVQTFALAEAWRSNVVVCQSSPRVVREKENGGSVLTMGGAREGEGQQGALELHPLSLIRGLFKFEQKGIWIQMK